MRGAIALGAVKGASCRAQPVRAPSTVKRCPTPPSPRSRGYCVVFVVYEYFFLLFGEERARTASYMFCHSNAEHKRGLYERKIRVRKAHSTQTKHRQWAPTPAPSTPYLQGRSPALLAFCVEAHESSRGSFHRFHGSFHGRYGSYGSFHGSCHGRN